MSTNQHSHHQQGIESVTLVLYSASRTLDLLANPCYIFTQSPNVTSGILHPHFANRLVAGGRSVGRLGGTFDALRGGTCRRPETEADDDRSLGDTENIYSRTWPAISTTHVVYQRVLRRQSDTVSPGCPRLASPGSVSRRTVADSCCFWLDLAISSGRRAIVEITRDLLNGDERGRQQQTSTYTCIASSGVRTPVKFGPPPQHCYCVMSLGIVPHGIRVYTSCKR